jgi:septation ring formation regulator EzrA
MRYSRDYMDSASKGVAREILVASLIAFVVVAVVTPLALIVVIRRFERDLSTLESAVSHLEDRAAQPPPTGSAFDGAIASLRESLQGVNKELDDVRAKLDAAR